jgi:tetratricopeptide (TPR) repeat protein
MATHQQGAYSQAEVYYQEALTIARQHELKTNEAMIRNSFSMLLLDQKEWQQAKANLLQSVRINYDLGHQDGLSWAFWGLLTLAYMEDHLEWTACLAGVLNALRQTLGAPLPPSNQAHFETIVSDLQQRLGEEIFSYQQNRGLTIPLRDIISLVLADDQALQTSDFIPKELED